MSEPNYWVGDDVVTKTGCFLWAENVRFVPDARPPDAQSSLPHPYYIIGAGNVAVVAAGTSLQSDEAFLVVPRELIYVRSDDRGKVIYAQRQTSNESSSGATTAAQLDLRNGKISFINREATKFLDERTAARPKPNDGKAPNVAPESSITGPGR